MPLREQGESIITSSILSKDRLDSSITEEERMRHGKSACVFTTSFPDSMGKGLGYLADDGLRQKLALANLLKLKAQGYNVVVVDYQSSENFLSQLNDAGVIVISQTSKTLSGAKQEGYMLASQLPGVKVIFTTEAEKDINPDELTQPILDGVADITFPHRGSLEGYPREQIEYENRISATLTQFLRTNKLIGNGEIFDFPNGTRAFRNTPEITSIFLRNYTFDFMDSDNMGNSVQMHAPRVSVKRRYDPEDSEYVERSLEPYVYYNSLTAPLIDAYFHNKIHPEDPYRISHVAISYKHDSNQTKAEDGNDYFRHKRRWQYLATVIPAGHHLRYLNNLYQEELSKINPNSSVSTKGSRLRRES